jgi:L-2-hydroxyglutarate oxidase
MERPEVVIVGGGIIGLSTAEAVLRARPRTSVVLLEKEARVAGHQSGRNSGVLHSGLYYRPGSWKARTAVAGRRSMLAFCAEEGIAHATCGKVVVATHERELDRLAELERRGHENGVRVERISAERLRELEPHARGVAALHVPETGVVDFSEVCAALARRIDHAGGALRFGQTVERIDRVVETNGDPLEPVVTVNCAGLHSDRLAGSTDVRIVAFRGEFHKLVPAREHLVRALIYPVPDPRFPFLGAHLTRGIHGTVHAGPNAVLAFAREGYSWRVVDRHHLAGLVGHRGVRTLAKRYWRVGLGEIARSLSRRLLARDLSRLVPGISAADLLPAPAGVRAQALDAHGALLDDFVIEEREHALHVVNAPSPAATASLEIGRHIAGLALARLP